MSVRKAVTHHEDRRNRVLALARSQGADGVVVTHLPDIRWICGFTGSNGLLLVTGSGSVLVTDGRYRNQAPAEVRGADVLIADGELFDMLDAVLPRTLLFQGDRVTVERANHFFDRFPETRFLSVSQFLDTERARKDEAEIECIRHALNISESVLLSVPEILREGITESEVAAEIDYRQRLMGAEGLAFDSIVAFGENAALPHARPGNRTLRPGDCVLIDTGCRIDGYVSDITRNYFFGRPEAAYLEVYAVVKAALEAAIHAAGSVRSARELDAVARDLIEKAGYGLHFSHSLGHGVGLEIHEPPRIAKSSDYDIPVSSVVTIEPGIYIPERFGVRIENMVVVRKDGCLCLNQNSTDLIRVDA